MQLLQILQVRFVTMCDAYYSVAHIALYHFYSFTDLNPLYRWRGCFVVGTHGSSLFLTCGMLQAYMHQISSCNFSLDSILWNRDE